MQYNLLAVAENILQYRTGSRKQFTKTIKKTQDPP